MNTQEKLNKQLFEAVASMKDASEVEAFFSDLCTYKEIEYMAQRIESARLLMQGETYAKVAKQVSVSTATLSRVNRCVQHGEGYNVLLRRFLESSEENTK